MKQIANGMEEVINVRIDSDDMYHPEAIGELAGALSTSRNNWFQWQNGYGYRYKEASHGSLKEYKPKHKSGPFFAHRYKKNDWLAKKIIMECQHQTVASKNPCVLSDGKVLVGIHENTSSTTINTGCFRRTIKDQRKRSILKEFGLL
jgi:hypothetical protein